MLLVAGSTAGAQVRFVQNGTAYTCYEQMPAFPGDLNAFLRTHRRYPVTDDREGRSVVRFVICDDGTVADPHIIRGCGHAALDSEALRLVRLMPRWTPGRGLHNQPVDVVYTLPVLFRQD